MATMFEIRDQLAGELKQIQLSRLETSKGWEILKELKETDYMIRILTDTIFIGVRK